MTSDSARSHPMPAAERVSNIRDLATALLAEAESLYRDDALAEVSSGFESLRMNSRLDFAEEVRRFEIRLISLTLELTGGNQSKAARLLGLGKTTLHYKIKVYQILEAETET